MIDNEATFKRFGYYADDLKPKSNKLIVRICDGCGKSKEIEKFNALNLCKSCGKKGKNYKLKIILTCEQCNNKFEVYPSRKNQKFCNKKCKGEWMNDQKGKNSPHWQGGKVTLICKQCNNKYQSAQSKNQKFCSKECQSKYKSENNISENHWNWQGGISGGKYCFKFNTPLKTQIREKYNNCDYISGLHTLICNKNRKLDVHHIDYNKSQGCDGSKWKLIPLSKSNHIKTNTNRPFWNHLFIYSLEIDKEYYTDNKVNIWEMI